MEINRRDFLKTSGVAATGVAALFVGHGAVWATENDHHWAFVIDLRRCIGCKACSIACKAEFNVVLGKFRSGVKDFDYGKYPQAKRGFVPWLCNHCNKPKCIENCPADEVEKPWGAMVAATYKRPDGVVVIDQDRCIGCGNCVEDCPYGVRYLDPKTRAGGDPEEKAADKCDLCLHRIQQGVVPSCVNTCPGDARFVVDLNDPDDPLKQFIDANPNMVKRLLLEEGTEPHCFYIDPEGNVDEAYRNSADKLSVMNKQ